MDYVYFVYGLAFVLLAAMCVTIRQEEPGSLPWAWLGLFGICHGTNEWLEMLVLPLGDSAVFAAVRLSVLALSFMLLLEFGRRGWIQAHGRGPNRWIHVPLLLAVLVGYWNGLAGCNGMVRYALGLPAAIWGAVTLLRAAPGKGKAATGLVLAAVALAGYALASGAIVPAAARAPASLLNDATFLRHTGFPIQIARAVLAILISISLWSYHLQRRRDMLDSDEGTAPLHGVRTGLALAVVLAGGWILTHVVGGHADEDIREELLTYTRVAAAVLDSATIGVRPESAVERGQSRAPQLERDLSGMLAASPQFRRVHVLVPDEAGRRMSVIASFPLLGPGSDAAQASVARDSPAAVFDAFAGHARLVGPRGVGADAYLAGFAPVLDRATGQVAAVLALEMDAAQWRKDVAEFRLAVIAVTSLISFLLIGFFVVRQRTWEAAESIAVSEARLAEAQEIAHVGSWAYDRPNGHMTWSREMFRILGCDPLRTISSYAEHQERVAAGDRESLDAAVQEALRTGRGFEREVRVVTPDGRQRSVISAARARRGVDGVVIRLVGTMQDITERKQAEDRLQQEHNLLRTLIDQLPDYIYVKDPRGRFLAANAAVARIMKTSSPDDLLGLTDADFYPPSLAEEFRRDEDLVLRTGQALINKDEPHVDPSGERRDVLTTKIPMRDQNGQIVGLVGISRDITERKQAEEEIQRLNTALEARVQSRTIELTAACEELESFSYSVSHDLRAPLRHVIGFLNLLKQSLHGRLEPPAAGYLEDSEREAARMAVLIDDLLAFSRTARAGLQRGPVNLAQLLQSVVAQFEPDTHGRQIAWKTGELPEVTGDADLLRQVLANLVDNALKFTRPRALAEIEVGCRPERTEWVVFVRDNGVGFDPAHADKLFGVFQRLHTRAQFEGTGVGLANVRRIIQRHGGRTWAESEEGRGATFYFSLPRVDGAAGTPPQEPWT